MTLLNKLSGLKKLFCQDNFIAISGLHNGPEIQNTWALYLSESLKVLPMRYDYSTN